MEDMIYLKAICLAIDFGSLLGVPTKISDSTYYSIYYVPTERGTYYIKLFNNNFLKKEENIKKLNESEELIKKLIDDDIPIMNPLELNEHKLQKVDNKYFYVYPYIKGNILKPQDVILEHCKQIGNILGKMHSANCHRIEKEIKPYINIRWRKYLRLAEYKRSLISKILNDNIEQLEQCTQLCNSALNHLPLFETITYQTLTCNNVIWNENGFYIFNSELLQHANPYVEMLNTALIWSGLEKCKVNYNLFEQFIKAYFKEMIRPAIDWNNIFDISYKNKLLEIENLIKIELHIDNNENYDSQLIMYEISEKIKELIYYVNIKEEIVNRLK